VSIRASFDRHWHCPGEEITGRVHWDGEDRPPGPLTISLEYVERTPDYAAVARTVEGERLEVEGPLEAGTATFGLVLPADALPACRSTHGELGWELVVSAEGTSWREPVVSVPPDPPPPPPARRDERLSLVARLRGPLLLVASASVGGAIAANAPLWIYGLLGAAIIATFVSWLLDRDLPAPPPEPQERK
jgi:hypothetical protein